MEYIAHIGVMISIYVIAAISLNLIAGYTGLLSVAHAALYGVGAYVVSIMGLRLGSPFWLNTVCAMLVAVVVSLLVSLPSLRLRDDYFVLATFGLQVVVTSIATNWVSLTGGPIGLSGVPRPAPFGVNLEGTWLFLIFACLLGSLSLAYCLALAKSPMGRVLRAIREDPLYAQSLGKDVARHKVVVVAIGAALAAVSGALFASYVTYVDPSSFTVQESIFMLAIVIVGGAGNLWGSVIGAVVLVALPEVLRFAGLPSSVAADVRQILYGVLLVVMMLVRPQGLIGEFDFRQRRGLQ